MPDPWFIRCGNVARERSLTLNRAGFIHMRPMARQSKVGIRSGTLFPEETP
jgi:hypothetical protein